MPSRAAAAAPPPPVSWRERGRNQNELGFSRAVPLAAGFDVARSAEDRSITSNGQESSAADGPAFGPGGCRAGKAPAKPCVRASWAESTVKLRAQFFSFPEAFSLMS